VDETEFGNEVDDTVALRDLHGDWEVVCGFWREEYVDCFLGEGGVTLFEADLDYVELAVSCIRRDSEKESLL
jgi:hypothetical protein